MLSDNGETGVVFNGCIYNFHDIRELESLGHRLRSQCDTEVLVRGYEQWGIDVLVPKLRGMFAITVCIEPAIPLMSTEEASGQMTRSHHLHTAARTVGHRGDLAGVAVFKESRQLSAQRRAEAKQ